MKYPERGVIALFPQRRTVSLSEYGYLQEAPFGGMLEVFSNHHASHQEPLYGASYTDKGLVDNHLAAFGGTTLRLTCPWGASAGSIPPQRADAPENGGI